MAAVDDVDDLISATSSPRPSSCAATQSPTRPSSPTKQT